MERIRLNREEKAVLRNIALQYPHKPTKLSEERFVEAVVTLTEKHLIASVLNYDTVVDCYITTKGKAYLQSNPHLHNPLRWDIITAIATTITAIVAIVALLIACSLH